MTNNKMPIVRRKYKLKQNPKIIVRVKKIIDENNIYCLPYPETIQHTLMNLQTYLVYSNYQFNYLFEEIPETNSEQEQPLNTKIEPDKNSRVGFFSSKREDDWFEQRFKQEEDCPAEQAAEEWNSVETNEQPNLQKEPDLTKITRLEVIDDKGRSYVNYSVKDLELSYQDEGRILKILCGKVEEYWLDKWSKDNAEALDAANKRGEYMRTIYQEYLQEEAKKKTEKEKPKSIWKDVSEKPSRSRKNNYSLPCLVEDAFGDITLATFSVNAFYDWRNGIDSYAEMKEGFLSPKSPIKYCVLTDFINHIENLEERIKKLEEKTKLL